MDNQEICEALKIIKNVCKATKMKHKDDCAIFEEGRDGESKSN